MDVLALIAGGRDGLKGMLGVSKTWQAGFQQSVTSIKVRHYRQAPPASSAFLKRFPSLVCMDLGGSSLDQASLWDLRGRSQLRSLKLGLSAAEFRLKSAGGAQSGPRPLAWKLRDDSLEGLRGLPLTRLDLRQCYYLRGEGLWNLYGAPLQELDLGGCDQLLEKSLKALRRLPLTALSLSDCRNVTDGSLEPLRKLPLTSLRLDGCEKLTGAGLEHLLEMPLGSLNLGMLFQLTDRDLGILHNLPLTSLNLGCPFLRPQGRAFCKFGNLGLAALQGLPLRHLDLTGWKSNMADSGLASLRGMPLSSLVLDGCWELSDAGLEQLWGLPLTYLSVKGVNTYPWLPKITQAGIQALRESIAFAQVCAWICCVVWAKNKLLVAFAKC